MNLKRVNWLVAAQLVGYAGSVGADMADIWHLPKWIHVAAAVLLTFQSISRQTPEGKK